MALVHVSVIPVGTVTTGIGDSVAEAVRVLKKSRVKYEILPFGTAFEAEPARALALARRMHQAAFKGGAARVLTTVLLDERRDKAISLRGKVEAVERRLKRG
jgi:uncharacterized protein (TIGR00106 family)